MGDRVEPVNAGAALAGALAREGAGDAGSLDEAAGRCGKHGERARAECGPVRSQARFRELELSGAGRRDPGAEVPADEEGLRLSSHAARVGEQGDEGSPEGDLVDARTADCARHGQQRCAGLVGRPDLAEPVAAVPRDQRDVRERLDVLDKSRRTADSPFERERRLECRLRLPAVQQVDDGCLLAGDEASG